MRWYSGRGGRFEELSMADAVAIWLLPSGQWQVLLTRHAAVSFSRPGITRAQEELSSEVFEVVIKSCIVILIDGEGDGSEDSVNEKLRSALKENKGMSLRASAAIGRHQFATLTQPSGLSG